MADTKPTVIEALAAVMGEVQAIGKTSRNQQQGFNFRGIDAVMNTVGPALRKHGVVIVPEDVQANYRDAQTTTGKAIREVTVRVTYRIHGPAGDSIAMQAIGESLDSGDKGSAKAMSVAYRVALLQALTIPTDEPDPDHFTYERSAPQRPTSPPPAADWPEAAVPPDKPLTEDTRGRLFALMTERGVTDAGDQRAAMGVVLGRPVESRSSLTEAEGRKLIASLKGDR